MEGPFLFSMVMILVLGVAAQWAAWRLRLPAILLLLTTGVLAGPVLGWLHPDEDFGRDLVLAFTSLGVAVILFEGGLSLKWSEIRRTGAVIPLLVTVGLLAGWLAAGTLAMVYAGFEFRLALLWGALMTVSGPTVIMPLLRQVRPAPRVRAILKWEAILVDPIGAILAVVVFEVFFISERIGWQPVGHLLLGLFGTGFAVGLGGAVVALVALKRFWVPDHLHVPLTLSLAVGAYALSGAIFEESGLLAVTVMGMAMANQKLVAVEHILEFKENLRVLLISSLFIVLAARLDVGLLGSLGWDFALLVGGLVLIVRPLGVFASTAFSSLSWKERLFLAGVMPRGIVAVAVATLFSLRLDKLGVEGGEKVTAYAIVMVVATVIIYGLGAEPLARRLKLADSDPQGVLILGADAVGRSLASAIDRLGFRALVVDRDRNKIAVARSEGLEAAEGDMLEEHVAEDLDLRGIGRFIAATANDEINDLAILQWTPLFGRGNVFRLAPNRTSSSRRSVMGQVLGFKEWTHDRLQRSLNKGYRQRAVATNSDPIPEELAQAWLIRSADGKRLRLLRAEGERRLAAGERAVGLLPAEGAPIETEIA